MAHSYNPSTPETKKEECEFRASLGYKVRPILKTNQLINQKKQKQKEPNETKTQNQPTNPKESSQSWYEGVSVKPDNPGTYEQAERELTYRLFSDLHFKAVNGVIVHIHTTK